MFSPEGGLYGQEDTVARLTRPEPSTRPQQLTVGLAVTLEEDQDMASEEQEWTLRGKNTEAHSTHILTIQYP